MKIRAGFVSNSSSSSFIVLLPENFIETVDFDKIGKKFEGDDEFNLEDFKKFVNKFYKNSGYSRDYYNNDESEYLYYDELRNITRSYVVADVESGPDDGDKIICLDRNKIKKLI